MMIAIFLAIGAPRYPSAQQIFIQRFPSEFADGVRAYHRGRYNDAILAFSNRITADSADHLARMWLGRSLFASGVEGAAIDQWEALLNREQLPNHVEFLFNAVRIRRELPGAIVAPRHYALTSELQGGAGIRRIFARPAGVAFSPDGSYYVASFASHEVVQIDINGRVLRRIGGRDYRFNRPYSIYINNDGTLTVSEFGSDRVVQLDDNSEQVARFRRAGNDGLLAGPQQIARDDDGNFYISDWGNNRVVIFNALGNYLFSIDGADIPQSRRISPTGIVIIDDRLMVVDQQTSSLLTFSLSGAFIDEQQLSALTNVESIARSGADSLLVAADEGIYEYSLATKGIRHLVDGGNGHITSAIVDQNGTIVATDFERNRLLFFLPVGDNYSGLVVRAHSINADAFPRVTLTLSVADYADRPIVGLQKDNFVILENGQEVAGETLYGSADEQPLGLVIVIPRTDTYRRDAQRYGEIIAEMIDALPAESAIAVAHGEDNPVLAAGLGASQVQMNAALEPAGRAAPSIDGAPFDLGVQLAAHTLLNYEGKRAVVYIDADPLYPQQAFKNIGSETLGRLLVNNAVQFSVIGIGEPHPSLQALVDETGGIAIQYAPHGSGREIINTLRNRPHGLYHIQYTSAANDDFGRRYINIGMEAYLLQRSGRDEIGYFAPRR